MTKKILCFSRSYLANFLPALLAPSNDLEGLHIVQTDAEQAKIEAAGQKVVLNLQELGRAVFKKPAADRPVWQEPDDMRQLTDFDWSPLYTDRYLPTFKEADRLNLAGAMQQAFEAIFAEHDIAGFLSEPVALFPTHYLYYLCKREGAVPLLWANTYFPGYFYFASDVHLANPVRKNTIVGAPQKALPDVCKSYVEKVSQDLAGPVYHHKFAAKKQTGLSYFRQRSGNEALVLTPSLSGKALQLARLLRVFIHRLAFPRLGSYMTAGAVAEQSFYMRNLLGSRRKYDKPTDQFATGNVFFPLQYEPEASLLYAAPDFRNQIAFVESILQALPEGHVLWVKEHPNQFGVLSNRTWQNLRKRYHNLRLVYGRENGRHLIQRCSLGVVITSTAGMDALIYGRTCLVLGDVFFRHFKGALPLRSIEALARELNNPENHCTTATPELDHTALVQQMVDFGQRCFPGDPQPAPDLYSEENTKHLLTAILNEVNVPKGNNIVASSGTD